MGKDYYSTLGISKSASQDEIKKAFRKLAQQHHPDKPGGDEAKFKEINEAYGILGDAKKRAQYDQFGSTGNFGGGQQGGFGGFGGFDFSNFAQGFGGQGGNVEFDLNDLFGSIFGGGRGGRRVPRGRDIVIDVSISFKESILGVKKTVTVDREKGGKEEITFTIPPGIDNGEMLRMNGKGEPIEGGTPGNLYVRVHVDPHKTLRKEGIHLIMRLPVKLTDAILGAKVDIDTLDEEKFVLKIPKGITHGEILRVRGKGVPMPARGGSGDLLIQVEVPTPTNLSGKAKKAIETLQEEGY
ncbi:MAG: hypothetical protein RL150_362 [Candidatus Parcubacteria bacterium]|jgi:DnaJ-class molecular chaperone